MSSPVPLHFQRIFTRITTYYNFSRTQLRDYRMFKHTCKRLLILNHNWKRLLPINLNQIKYCLVFTLDIQLAGSNLGVCKPLNGTGPPQSMGLKKNCSPIVLLIARSVFFWEGGLRFLMYTVVVFTFGCTVYILHLVFIF